MIYLNIFLSEIYKIIFLLLPVLVSVALIVWLDRRVWAFVQKRRGPNVVGPFGLLQTLSDALKYIFKDLANMIKKPLEYNNVKYLRESINKNIQKRIDNVVTKTNKIDFIDENISIKPINYYYTNPIARSSKIMGECRKISKRLSFTGIERAS